MKTRKRKTIRSVKPATRRPAQASTRDILGAPSPPVRIAGKWAAHHRHLIQLRDHFLRLRQRRAGEANEEQPNFSEHMADAATDSFDRDFALGLLSSDQDALYEIEEAIRRIETGTYGICELTGKLIQPRRLEAIPWTRFSLEAEKQLERGNGRSRARLGDLRSLNNGGLKEEEEPEPEPAAPTEAGA